MGYLLNDIADARRMATLALLTQTLDVGYGLNLRTSILGQLLDTPGAPTVAAATSGFPVHRLLVADRATALICLSGTRVQSGIAEAIASYIDPSKTPFDVNIVDKFTVWAGRIPVVAWVAGLSPQPTRVSLSGHSLGSGIALAMALAIKTANPTMNVDCTLFGSPRFCGYATVATFGGIKILRVRNEGDGLPLLPPQPDDAPGLYAVLTRRQQQSVRVWSHPCNELRVSSAGVLTSGPTPRPIAPYTTASIAALMNSDEGFFGNAHLIGSYVDSLLAAVPAITPVLPPPPPLPVPPLPAPPVINTPPPVFTPAENIVIRGGALALREAASNQETGGVSIPRPSNLALEKGAGLYTVTWCGYTIATLPTKKKGSALKRHFNKFLRIFQTVAQCQSQDFVAALSQYLTDAADPTKGYRPTLLDGGKPPDQVIP